MFAIFFVLHHRGIHNRWHIRQISGDVLLQKLIKLSSFRQPSSAIGAGRALARKKNAPDVHRGAFLVPWALELS
jgi:hypothetical protein